MVAASPSGGTVVAFDLNKHQNNTSEWCAAETVLHQRDGLTLWQVETNCREHRILVWGRTRSEAWEAASRMADRIQREE